MKLSKNKKNEKNKNRFVFLSFLPETDAFSTRHRLEVQRPCFENFLTDLRELRSDNQDVPPAQVQQVRHEAGEVGEGCLRLQQRGGVPAARCKVRLLPRKHILVS
jgi:hypothetical protein